MGISEKLRLRRPQIEMPKRVRPATTPVVETPRPLVDLDAQAERTERVAASTRQAPIVASTVPGFAETFPLQNLSGIEGKGSSGTTFLLDGGSLSGQQLTARRVIDDGEPGFEQKRGDAA